MRRANLAHWRRRRLTLFSNQKHQQFRAFFFTGDGFNFDHRLRGVERTHLNNRVGGIGRRKPFPAQLDHLVEVEHVSEKDRDLDDILETRAASPQNAIEILESLLGLSIEVSYPNNPSARVNGDLARDEKEITGPIALCKAERLVWIKVAKRIRGQSFYDCLLRFRFVNNRGQTWKTVIFCRASLENLVWHVVTLPIERNASNGFSA